MPIEAVTTRLFIICTQSEKSNMSFRMFIHFLLLEY